MQVLLVRRHFPVPDLYILSNPRSKSTLPTLVDENPPVHKQGADSVPKSLLADLTQSLIFCLSVK